MCGRQFVPFLLIFVCLSVPPVLATDPQRTYTDGVDQLYNLDFPAAEAAFRPLAREYPDNPDYWNALASTYWLNMLYKQQKLNMESFSGKDRFGTSESKDDVSAEDEKQLREAVNKAIAASDALLKKDPRNIPALYAKGVGYATLASFDATVRRSWLSAARNAKRARNLHEDILELDPNFNDARTSVGMYNYAVGSLSWGARLVVGIVGLGGGDKEAGIRDLETAAAKGVRAAVEAKMMLIIVYGREQQYDKALKLINELHARYPRNFMLDMSRGALYGKMKRWDLAAETYQKMADKITAHKDGYERMRIEKVYYELANSEFQGQKFEEATRTFNLVASGLTATPNEKANAHLWMGRMSDTRHDRPDALKHYNAVLKLDADPDVKSDAERLIRKPFGSP